VTNPVVSLPAVLFVAALLTHAWVGLRDVTLDYVAPLAARIASLSLVALALLAVAAWFVRILLLARG
jgi:succinate dehydrogenase / fumarate reductase membrane anchor subunit